MDNKKSFFIILKGLVCLFGLCISVLAGTTDSYASITCVTCHGRGEVTCSACGGSGGSTNAGTEAAGDGEEDVGPTARRTIRRR